MKIKNAPLLAVIGFALVIPLNSHFIPGETQNDLVPKSTIQEESFQSAKPMIGSKSSEMDKQNSINLIKGGREDVNDTVPNPPGKIKSDILKFQRPQVSFQRRRSNVATIVSGTDKRNWNNPTRPVDSTNSAADFWKKFQKYKTPEGYIQERPNTGTTANETDTGNLINPIGAWKYSAPKLPVKKYEPFKTPRGYVLQTRPIASATAKETDQQNFINPSKRVPWKYSATKLPENKYEPFKTPGGYGVQTRPIASATVKETDQQNFINPSKRVAWKHSASKLPVNKYEPYKTPGGYGLQTRPIASATVKEINKARRVHHSVANFPMKIKDYVAKLMEWFETMIFQMLKWSKAQPEEFEAHHQAYFQQLVKIFDKYKGQLLKEMKLKNSRGSPYWGQSKYFQNTSVPVRKWQSRPFSYYKTKHSYNGVGQNPEQTQYPKFNNIAFTGAQRLNYKTTENQMKPGEKHFQSHNQINQFVQDPKVSLGLDKRNQAPVQGQFKSFDMTLEENVQGMKRTESIDPSTDVKCSKDEQEVINQIKEVWKLLPPSFDDFDSWMDEENFQNADSENNDEESDPKRDEESVNNEEAKKISVEPEMVAIVNLKQGSATGKKREHQVKATNDGSVWYEDYLFDELPEIQQENENLYEVYEPSKTVNSQVIEGPKALYRELYDPRQDPQNPWLD